MKYTKTYIHCNDGKYYVHIVIEMIMKNHDEFKYNLELMLEAIQATLTTFREKMEAKNE
jgi:hypothetical protein